MGKLILICVLICCACVILSADICAPTNIRTKAEATSIFVSWSFVNDTCDKGEIVVVAEPETTITELDWGASVGVPYSCKNYVIGVLPYSEGGAQGPIQYVNQTTKAPASLTIADVWITKNDTHVVAEWTPDPVAKYCFDQFQVYLFINNYASPLDDELNQMALYHKVNTTSFTIMPVEECVNRFIGVSVGSYLSDSLIYGETISANYTC